MQTELTLNADPRPEPLWLIIINEQMKFGLNQKHWLIRGRRGLMKEYIVLIKNGHTFRVNGFIRILNVRPEH